MTSARTSTIAGLLVAASGIMVLYIAGVSMPLIPPSLVILVAAAAVLTRPQWRWAPVAGVLAALFEGIGFVAGGSAAGLTAGTIAVVVGNWLRIAGVVVALVAGARAGIPARAAR